MKTTVSPARAQTQQVIKLATQFQATLDGLAGPKHPDATLDLGTDGKAPDPSMLFLTVLLQTPKSAQKDLKALITQMRAVNDARQAWRSQVEGAVRPPEPDFDASLQLVATLYGNQIETEVMALKGQLDAMTEMSELASLRLQMVMDRLSKLMTTLSNLLKKIADTQQQIVQNLK